MKLDVDIIGVGACVIALFHARKDAGKLVVVVDRVRLRAPCARVGCMPSKAAVHAGMRWLTARQLPGGAAQAAQGPQALWAHARQTRDALASGAAERIHKAAGESLIMAEARFVAPGILEAGNQRLEADAFYVANG